MGVGEAIFADGTVWSGGNVDRHGKRSPTDGNDIIYGDPPPIP